MQVKEISVGFTFLKKLPDFENLRVDAGVVMTVEAGEDPEAVYAKAFANVKKQITRGLETAKGGFNQ